MFDHCIVLLITISNTTRLHGILWNVVASSNVCLFPSSRWKSLSHWNQWQLRGNSVRDGLCRARLHRGEHKIFCVLCKRRVHEISFLLYLLTVYCQGGLTNPIASRGISKVFNPEDNVRMRSVFMCLTLLLVGVACIACFEQCANFNLDQKSGQRCLYYSWSTGPV